MTDLRMPEISGSELAKSAEKIIQNIEVLVMVAHAVERELQKLLPSVDEVFLQKKFHMPDAFAVKRRLLAA